MIQIKGVADDTPLNQLPVESRQLITLEDSPSFLTRYSSLPVSVGPPGQIIMVESSDSFSFYVSDGTEWKAAVDSSKKIMIPNFESVAQTWTSSFTTPSAGWYYFFANRCAVTIDGIPFLTSRMYRADKYDSCIVCLPAGLTVTVAAVYSGTDVTIRLLNSMEAVI